MNWNKYTEKQPDKKGEYLVVRSIMGIFNRIDVCAFSLNLHKVDEFDFPDENRPGWYAFDSETGCFEVNNILYWAELPEIPDERKNRNG